MRSGTGWPFSCHSEWFSWGYRGVLQADEKVGLGSLCHRFGLEGLVTFKRENEYDAETYEIMIPAEPEPVTIGVFDKVLVEITVEKVSGFFVLCDSLPA